MGSQAPLYLKELPFESCGRLYTVAWVADTQPVFRRETEHLSVRLTPGGHGEWVIDEKGTALTQSFSKALP